jgi:TolB-like protein/Tfp pilus assembly protein PilF
MHDASDCGRATGAPLQNYIARGVSGGPYKLTSSGRQRRALRTYIVPCKYNVVMELFSPGMTVSHFRLIEKLGSGATGDVFRAEDTFLQRQVALKLLTRIETSEQKERFLREARLCSSLIHPNIAIIYEAGWQGSVPFLAVELIEGEMLSRKIRRQEVSAVDAIAFMKQILKALDEAHSRGIIHRDVKSSNIMISQKHQVKVLDFGLAKEIKEDPHFKVTTPGTVVGTIEFLSPEQARAETLDHRTDLFSAGVVFYHMLTGRLPFERETQIATYSAILKDQPGMIHAPELDSILQKALNKNREERYQTALEFLTALEGLDSRQVNVPHIVREDQRIKIAVLYFERLEEQEESEYLRLGITEDIIIDLSKVAGISVLSRHAVQKYRNRPIVIPEVIRELQVDFVLHGTVQKTGDMIRVLAELVDGETGQPIWNEEYERQMQDIFELQDHVAKSITEALQIRLTDSERRSIGQRSTQNLKAYEYYLKGKHHYQQYSSRDNALAEEMLKKSVRLDPDFAVAHAALAETYVQRFYNWFDRDRCWLSMAEEVIQRACRLNDQLPEVHCTLGQLLYLRGEYEKAMEEVQKSIRLDPHYALAHDHSGEIYLHMGELDKAILAFHTEMRINEEVIYPYFYLVWIHSLLGDFAIAREVLEKARQKHSRNILLHVLEGTYTSYSGDFEAAENFLRNALVTNSSNSFAAARLSVVLAQTERWTEAIALIEEATERIDPRDHHAAFDRACVMALRNETENSILWLQRAVDLGWRCKHHFEREPNLNSVRKHPRFVELLQRI